MFNANADLAAKVDSFRRERIRLIRGNASGRPLVGPGQLVLHVMPISSISGRQQIDLSIVEQNHQLFQPLEASTGYGFRYTLEGAITQRNIGADSLGYTQIFRDGMVESTKGRVLGDTAKVMQALYNERAAIETLRRIVAGYKLLNVPPPFAVGLTLLASAAAYYRTRVIRGGDDLPAIIGSHEVFLPIGQVTAYGGNEIIDAALRPAFDALWNSAGYPRDEWFDENGVWTEPPPSWEI